MREPIPKAYPRLPERYFLCCLQVGTGRSLRISYLSRCCSLYPISSLSQSSYWMSWPSSMTHLLCYWMGKLFRTLLLRISKSSGQESSDFSNYLTMKIPSLQTDTWRSKGVPVARHIWPSYWKGEQRAERNVHDNISTRVSLLTSKEVIEDHCLNVAVCVQGHTPYIWRLQLCFYITWVFLLQGLSDSAGIARRAFGGRILF